MASDRGQNRYSDFVALETLLRFENCSSSHCLLSSWRRFHVFELSHPPFHRTVFFGTPLAFRRGVAMGYVVVASFLCLRVVGSSFRLPSFAWYLVAVLPCYPVTLLLCYLVTMLLCYLVTLLLRYLVTMLPCYSVILSLCYSCTDITCISYTFPFFLGTLFLCYPVTLLLCHLVNLLLCYPVTL